MFNKTFVVVILLSLVSAPVRAQESDAPASPVETDTPLAPVEIARQDAPGPPDTADDTVEPGVADETVEPKAKDDTVKQVPLTPEQEAAVKAYLDARVKWADTLKQMKAITIRYNNDDDQSPGTKESYAKLRDLAREQMNTTFDRALDLFKAIPGDFDSGSMLATMLEYREGSSIYENSREAAELLLESELTFPYLYQIAARSSFLEGKYDAAMKHYEAFVKLNGFEKLDDVDKMLGNVSEIYPKFWEKEQELREAEAKADDLPRVRMETTRGPVLIELFENEAPNTVANFIKLAEDGYYDGADFYQVVDDFLAMGGDPVGDGTSTSGKYIPDEHDHPNTRQLFRGSLVMAKIPNPREKGAYVPNSASSQFAIALMPYLQEDPQQTVFGRVIEGMEVVSTFRRVDPAKKKEKSVQLPPDRILSIQVLRKRDHDYAVKYMN